MANEHQAMVALGQLVHEVIGAGPDEASRAAQRRALTSLVRARRPSPVLRWAAAAGACALVAGLTLAGLIWLSRPDFRFWVGAERVEGQVGQLVAAAAKPVDLHFDDDTTVELAPSTDAKVQLDTDRDVRLVMGPGKVRAKVNKKTKRRWTIEAGPYRVTVVGTEFSVHWQRREACLDVHVDEGRVRVTGRGLDRDGEFLGAGDSLHRCESKPAPVRPSPAPEAAPEEPASEQPTEDPAPRQGWRRKPEPAEPEDPEPALAEPEPGPVKVASLSDLEPETWRDFHDLGRHAEAIRLAEQAGIERLLREASPDDLWALAESARKTRRGELAKRAFMKLRHKAPEHHKAKLAAFLLGRVAMELRGQPAIGADWFRVYLEEDPEGPLVEEALGRRLQALQAAGWADQARAVAKQYLSRYPDGMFAISAQQALTP